MNRPPKLRALHALRALRALHGFLALRLKMKRPAAVRPSDRFRSESRMRSLPFLMPALLATALFGCRQIDSADEQAAPSSTPADPDAPPEGVCDAPRCGNARNALRIAPALGPRLVHRPPAEIRAHLQTAFAEQRPAARLLADLLTAAQRGEASPIDRATAAWMTTALDAQAPDWRAPATIFPRPDAPPLGLATGQLALETAGCGDMALQIHIDGITVVERDDNVADDRVYCIAQAEDAQGTEVLKTGVTRPLDAGEYAGFAETLLYGNAGPRDPGRQLRVRYDCWEYDTAEDYERFRQAAAAIERIGEALGPAVYVDAKTISELITLMTEIAAVFDGDDHLFQAQETLNRQALWGWILDGERILARGGSNNTSDWSWQLHVRADGCAGIVEPAPEADACDALSCDGCCVAGRCLAGDDEQACGAGGAACGSCGSGERCRAGACQFDPRAQYDVVLLAAQIHDDCWDAPCGEPDPYVWLSAGGQRARSSLVEDTRLPTWRETLLNGVRASDLMAQLSIEVFDDDYDDDDPIGACTVQFSEAELREAGPFELRCGAARLTIELAPR